MYTTPPEHVNHDDLDFKDSGIETNLFDYDSVPIETETDQLSDFKNEISTGDILYDFSNRDFRRRGTVF